MDEYNELKVKTFTGINSNPIPPTPEQPSNGSYLIAKHNGLVTKLQTEITALKDRLTALESPVDEGTDEAYTWSFFAEPPEGRTFIVDSPISGTITKYFIDNIDIETSINAYIGLSPLIYREKVAVGTGVEYRLSSGVSIDYGHEISVSYVSLEEEIDSTLTLYIS